MTCVMVLTWRSRLAMAAAAKEALRRATMPQTAFTCKRTGPVSRRVSGHWVLAAAPHYDDGARRHARRFTPASSGVVTDE